MITPNSGAISMPSTEIFTGLSIPESELCSTANRLRAARESDLDRYRSERRSDDVYCVPEPDVRGGVEYEVYWPGGREPVQYFDELSPSEWQVVHEFCDQHDAEVVGIGVCRVAVAFESNPEFVVKLPRWGTSVHMCRGVDQNKFEMRIFDQYQETHSPPLLPYVCGDPNGLWLMQPRVEAFPEYSASKDADSMMVALDAAQKRLQEQTAEIEEVFFEEFSPHCFGKWQNEWYVFDYGRPADPNIEFVEPIEHE